MLRSLFLCLVPGCILTTVACAAAPVTPAVPASTVSTSGNVTGKAVWPNINSFTVSSDNISPGENVTLRWDTAGGDMVTITPGVGSVAPDGYVTIAPQSTTRYELDVANARGRALGWVMVTVNVPPVLLPDLVISGVTYNSGLLYYMVKNMGTSDAGPFYTWLYDMSHMQRDQSWVGGLKAGEEKRGEFSNFQYTGNEITICADGDGDIEESNEDNNCYVPTWGFRTTYDMQQYASRASWRSSAGNVPFGGKQTSAEGMVNRAATLLMEDGQSYSNVIEIYSPPQGYSWIEGLFGEIVEQWQSGSYMIPMEIPHNARFTARVGLAEDAEDRSGITFLFGVIGPDGTRSFWPGVSANYDGRLEAFDIDLNAYAGKKVMAILRVEAGAATTGNHAAWIDPRISQ